MHFNSKFASLARRIKTHVHLRRQLDPVTLLDVEYEILAKIAKRIELVLQKLIHPDQTGFIKGRFIRKKFHIVERSNGIYRRPKNSRNSDVH